MKYRVKGVVRYELYRTRKVTLDEEVEADSIEDAVDTVAGYYQPSVYGFTVKANPDVIVELVKHDPNSLRPGELDAFLLEKKLKSGLTHDMDS